MKSNDGVNIVVLSAGKGTRMKSELPKVLHKIGGLTLLQHIVISVESLNCKKNIIIITSNDVIDEFADFLNKDKKLHYVIQEKRLGTGHAVNCAMESKFWHSDSMYTGVFYGDVPFIKQETISDMFESLGKFDLIILGFDAKDQSQAYGRLFTDKELMVGQCGKLFAIKEFGLSLVESIKMMFTGHVGMKDLTGPVGISGIISKTETIIQYLYMMSIISVSLGLTNLLPIPALDGGKNVLLIIEAIRKKPLKENTEITIQLIGFFIIIILSVFVTYNDIHKLFY